MRFRSPAAIALLVAACGGPGVTPITGENQAPRDIPIRSTVPVVSTTTATSTSTTPAPATTLAPAPATTATPETTVAPQTNPPPQATVAADAHAVVMAGFAGAKLDDATAAHLAGGGRAVVLFGRNIESRAQIRDLTRSIACAAAGPVIVAVDQEPGRVARLSAVGIPAPTLDASAAEYEAAAAAMATAMLALGINLDLAPISDVARGENPVLVGRNLGPDTELVAQRTISFIEALHAAGVGATAKHFPGHGLARVDPHREVTVIDAPLETLQSTDFPPFLAAIGAGVDAVMIGHPIYEALDPTTPASLSPAVLGMLRDDFAYDGVAITDGLSMAALRQLRTIEEIAVEAIAAGADLLLADRPSDIPRIIAALLDGVESGNLARQRLAEAAGRVRDLAAQLTPVTCDG